MKNYNKSVKMNHNPNQSYICDHHYRILIIDGSGSGKTNALMNLITHQQPDAKIIYLQVKDSFE